MKAQFNFLMTSGQATPKWCASPIILIVKNDVNIVQASVRN